MKIVYGQLLSAAASERGTNLLIHADEEITALLEHRRVGRVQVGFDDGRHISPSQRRKIYATLRDISEHTGYDPESAKQIMKLEHMARAGMEAPFSLSDCSMTTAREFINTLMDYSLREGIILTETGLQRTDDIDSYLLQCIRYRRCCICGQAADIHHQDAIGMGNDRRRTDDSGKRIIALCRKHHQAAHAMGNLRFMEMYKVYGIEGSRAEAYAAWGRESEEQNGKGYGTEGDTFGYDV